MERRWRLFVRGRGGDCLIGTGVTLSGARWLGLIASPLSRGCANPPCLFIAPRPHFDSSSLTLSGFARHIALVASVAIFSGVPGLIFILFLGFRVGARLVLVFPYLGPILLDWDHALRHDLRNDIRRTRPWLAPRPPIRLFLPKSVR